LGKIPDAGGFVSTSSRRNLTGLAQKQGKGLGMFAQAGDLPVKFGPLDSCRLLSRFNVFQGSRGQKPFSTVLHLEKFLCGLESFA
jgi:hypothetical protein